MIDYAMEYEPSRCRSCPTRQDISCPGVRIPDICRNLDVYQAKLEAWGSPRAGGGLNPPDPPLPSLASQALSAAGAVARVAAAAVTGQAVLVPDEVYEMRLAVCRACPHHRADDRCGLCGCYLAGAKARLATEHCPIGKWDAYRL